MAGGKETPRQKLIGMMYLVLTALLALNVSSAVLEKFVIIDTTLSELLEESKVTNDSKFKGIIDASSQAPKVLEAKAKAKKVTEITASAIKYLDDLKKKLKTGDDGKEFEGENYWGNMHRPEEYFLNEKAKATVGKEYENQLDKFVDELNKEVNFKVPFAKLTRSAKDYKEFKNSIHNDKDFLTFSFENTPLPAAIASISQLQTEVIDYEAQALDSLNAIAEGVNFKADQVVPMVRAESNTLVAGQDYVGNLFVTASSSGINPEMFKDGKPVSVEEVEVTKGVKVKMGKIKFQTSASSYNAEGKAEASFKVRINLPGREPIEDVVKYTVLRPVAKFESVAASTLYSECGNEMSVSVQGLTDLSTLNLTCGGDEGSIQKMGPGKFVLIPRRPQMNVNITMNGVSIGSNKFSSKSAPQPIGALKIGTQDYDPVKGIPVGASIIKYVPEITDETFIKQNAKDAAYRITSMVLQITGKTPINLTSGTIELAKFGLRAGDTFSLSNVQVVRSTWDPNDADNKPVNAKMSNTFKMASK
jgi:gliding motility-associated protein GldM